jgi:hypothetical protein
MFPKATRANAKTAAISRAPLKPVIADKHFLPHFPHPARSRFFASAA